jgi:hypothetical protein
LQLASKPPLEWSAGTDHFLESVAFTNRVREAAAMEKRAAKAAPYIKRAVERPVIKVGSVLLPAQPIAAQVVVACEPAIVPVNTPGERARRAALVFIQSIGGFGYLWTVSQKERNALMHALNGNILPIPIMLAWVSGTLTWLYMEAAPLAETLNSERIASMFPEFYKGNKSDLGGPCWRLTITMTTGRKILYDYPFVTDLDAAVYRANRRMTDEQWVMDHINPTLIQRVGLPIHYVWSLTTAAWNRLMHSTNGNILFLFILYTVGMCLLAYLETKFGLLTADPVGQAKRWFKAKTGFNLIFSFSTVLSLLSSIQVSPWMLVFNVYSLLIRAFSILITKSMALTVEFATVDRLLVAFFELPDTYHTSEARLDYVTCAAVCYWVFPYLGNMLSMTVGSRYLRMPIIIFVNTLFVYGFFFYVSGWTFIFEFLGILFLFASVVMTFTPYFFLFVLCVLLEFIFFYFILRVLFITKVAVEILALRHQEFRANNGRPQTWTAAMKGLVTRMEVGLMTLEAVVSILTLFTEMYTGDHYFNQVALHHLLFPNVVRWETWWLPIATSILRLPFLCARWVMFIAFAPLRWVRRFIRRTVPSVFHEVVAFFTPQYNISECLAVDCISLANRLGDVPLHVAFLMLLPINLAFHLCYGHALVYVFEDPLQGPLGREDRLYNYVRFRIFASLFVSIPLFFTILFFPVLYSVFSWLATIFIFIIIFAFFIGVFDIDMPQWFFVTVSLFLPLISHFTYTTTMSYRRAFGFNRDTISVALMRRIIGWYLDAGVILQDQHPRVLRFKHPMTQEWCAITVRDNLPDDPLVVKAAFYHLMRRNNRPYMDLFLFATFWATVAYVLLKVVECAFSGVARVFKALKLTLTWAILLIFMPNWMIEAILVEFTLFRQYLWYHLVMGRNPMRTPSLGPLMQKFSGVISSSLAFTREFLPEHQYTRYGYLRLARSLIIYLGMRAWFSLHYITIEDLEDEVSGLPIDPEAIDNTLNHTKLPGNFGQRRVNILRAQVKRLVFALDNFRLPEFLQAQYRSPTPASIKETYRKLRDLGFPIDNEFIESIRAPSDDAYLAEWSSLRQHIRATTDFKFNIPRFKVELAQELRDFGFPGIPGYIHTSTYTDEDAEVRSTLRYFTDNNNVNLPDGDIVDIIEAAWDHVKVQYADSKLSSPAFIFKHWVKKYNMGFGFRSPKTRGGWRQMRRAEAIKTMGGKKGFLRAWKEVFAISTTLVGIAPVFTKMETLKLKKAINKQVRTVVGSAFVHSVMTYIFNFKPNHNYKPWENSSKVGMPINGLSFSKLFASLLKHDAVWAGDMTAFDSTVPPVIIRMVRDLRKKGYEHHRDYERLTELIDTAYDHLIHQPLGFKSLGEIVEKEQGFTTGHTSTTPDNTLALLLCYLFAWRRVTGLRSREFFNFNTLANFGDDHVLGYDKVFGWHPEKAAKAMLELGIIMRDEGDGQTTLPDSRTPSNGRDMKITFLAKQPLWISGDVLEDLRLAGVSEDLAFAVCHDKARLIGKIKGQTQSRKGPIERYTRLASYLDLTAHHRDVYDSLRSALHRLESRNAAVFKRAGVKLPALRSYKDVVRHWYSGGFDSTILKEEVVDSLTEEEKEFSIFEQPTPLDYIVRWLADVPTILSPRYANTRWVEWVQHKLSKNLSWPLAFITRANCVSNDSNVALDLLAKTPYAFLRAPGISANHVSNCNLTTLYIRHYLYCTYTFTIKSGRAAFSILDYVRVLDNAIINLVFIISGKIIPITMDLDFHILDTLIIILLDRLHVPELRFTKYMLIFHPEAPSTVLAKLLANLVNTLSPSGSIDMQPLYACLDNLRDGQTWVIDAPTGVGKSTRMVDRIQSHLRTTVVVIQPRHLLVTSVVSYMQSIFPNSGISGATEGLTPTRGDRIIYATPQSFLMSSWLRDPSFLVILDEAHVNEPAYDVIHRYLQVSPHRKLYMTATPRDTWGFDILTIPSVSAFKKEIFNVSVDDISGYVRKVVRVTNERFKGERTLIFVHTVELALSLASQIKARTCILSSKHKTVDETAEVYISTSVSDAGLTIPDVSYVHTMDVGVHVSLESVFKAPKVTRYRLSQSTLTQRAGRTGRTSNGIVFIYHLPVDFGAEPDVPPHSAMDYVNAVPTVITQVVHLLPTFVQFELERLFPEVANLEAPDAVFTLLDATYSEFDAEFGLGAGSKELLRALSPAFLRGFRDIFDTLGEGGLDLFFTPFHDIGLFGDNNLVPSTSSALEERVGQSTRDEPPPDNSGDTSQVSMPVRRTAIRPLLATPDSLQRQRILENPVQPPTTFDQLDAPVLRPNLVGLMYFGGKIPYQGPELRQTVTEFDLDESDSSDDEDALSNPSDDTPGHIDAAGIPHAYRPHETPAIWSAEDRAEYETRIIQQTYAQAVSELADGRTDLILCRPQLDDREPSTRTSDSSSSPLVDNAVIRADLTSLLAPTPSPGPGHAYSPLSLQQSLNSLTPPHLLEVVEEEDSDSSSSSTSSDGWPVGSFEWVVHDFLGTPEVPRYDTDLFRELMSATDVRERYAGAMQQARSLVEFRPVHFSSLVVRFMARGSLLAARNRYISWVTGLDDREPIIRDIFLAVGDLLLELTRVSASSDDIESFKDTYMFGWL